MTAPHAGSPFDFDPDAEAAGPVRRRRRRGSWLGPVVLLVFLGAAAGGAYFAWPHLQKALVPPTDKSEQVAQNDKGEGTAPATSRPKSPQASTPKRPPTTVGSPDAQPPEPPPGSNKFPRRALVISVHNYLYANPVHYGPPGSSSHNIINFPERVLARANGLKVPLTQIAVLSDGTDLAAARPPMKTVIQKTVTDFLQSSRPQDRILLFFIGHGVEIKGEAYLVPIEGELDNPDTLIPLKWFYDQLAACNARQKVFVVDVSRFSATSGQERPDGGPLSAKFAEALQKPPAGVQVWSACSADQRSHETDIAPEGAFLEALYNTIVDGKIQHENDPFPLEYLKDHVNELLAKELRQRKLEQVSFLAGTEPANGADYDPGAPLPARPSVAPVPSNKENAPIVKGVLEQIGTPPIKPSSEAQEITYTSLPPFDQEVLKKYEDDAEKAAELRKAVQSARAVLWAISREVAPKNIAADVAATQKRQGKTLEVIMRVLTDGERAPAPGQENVKKEMIANNERDVARIMGRLTEALEDLESVKAMRAEAPKRWQANYDFVLARLEAQMAFLYEYQTALGRMRKEFPERDPKLHGGWRLAATIKLQGDSAGKKLAKDSTKLLEKLAKEHKGTPWEVLAKREKLTALGLEWQPTR
jgi:hypothetical protein